MDKVRVLIMTVFNVLILALPTKVEATIGVRDKGVVWQMGNWYVNGTYNWEGMRADLDRMKEAGINWVRFSFGRHTQSTCTTTGFYTKLADELDQRSIHGVPDISIPNQRTTTATATEVQAYKDWLATMVGCYKDRFKNWEVWNEPNGASFWNINPLTTDDAAYARSVAYYVTYLRASYETIKNIDPTANVILGGLMQDYSIRLTDGRTVGSMTRWMDEFIRQEGYTYIDSWGFHPYSDYDPARGYTYRTYSGCGAASVQRLDEFKAYAYSSNIPLLHRTKPIWLTEIGFTATADEYPGNTKGSESVKAHCLSATWQYFRENGITTPIFWFDFSQDSLATTRQEGYSLVPSNKVTGELRLNDSYRTYASLWPPLPTINADVNRDGVVNILDYNLVVINFGRTGTAIRDNTDVDGNLRVDIYDYNLLIQSFGTRL